MDGSNQIGYRVELKVQIRDQALTRGHFRLSLGRNNAKK